MPRRPACRNRCGCLGDAVTGLATTRAVGLRSASRCGLGDALGADEPQGIQGVRRVYFRRLLLVAAIPACITSFAACGSPRAPVQVRLVRPSSGAVVPAGAPLTLSVSTTGTGGPPADGTLASYMISVPGSNPAWAKLTATSAGTSAFRSITIPAASLFPAGCYYSSATSTCYNVCASWEDRAGRRLPAPSRHPVWDPAAFAEPGGPALPVCPGEFGGCQYHLHHGCLTG